MVCDGAPDVTGLHDMDEYIQAQLLLAVSWGGRAGRDVHVVHVCITCMHLFLPENQVLPV